MTLKRRKQNICQKVLGQPCEEIRAEQNASIRDDSQRKRETQRILNLESIEKERQAQQARADKQKNKQICAQYLFLQEQQQSYLDLIVFCA